jgi:class 3 adenylate cyclase/HAMP domain-containing protein
MKISLTKRIWLTVAVIIVIFTVLVVYIIPNQQEEFFTETFNNEAQNLTSIVALGITVGNDKMNYEVIEGAMDITREDTRLKYLVWIDDFGDTTIVPEGAKIDLNIQNNDTILIQKKECITKKGTSYGYVLAVFSKQQIHDNMNQIRFSAIVVSVVVFMIGILLGLWLAKTISNPVIAIRDAAIKVGSGDLTQKVGTTGVDEISELSKAFNKMVDDLSDAEVKINQKNQALSKSNSDLEEKNNIISIEKKKSDKLLLNILPEKTAEELKKYGHTKPQHYNEVSVMFIDFAKFTHIAEKLTPEELVQEIDYCFRKFDEIVIRYGIEKIKTIGDAYLCVGGLPEVNNTHSRDCIRAAHEIHEFLLVRSNERKKQSLPFFESRIGIHSGPLVAGVVGINKFAFDIWGDTVNVAARMESAGEVNKINISRSTYSLVSENKEFVFENRGEHMAKNKGNMEMYFASIAKPT